MHDAELFSAIRRPKLYRALISDHRTARPVFEPGRCGDRKSLLGNQWGWTDGPPGWKNDLLLNRSIEWPAPKGVNYCCSAGL